MTESRKSLLSTLLFSLILALTVEHRIFTDPMAINDDVRNQIYWMAKLINPSYFANDYLADYFSQPSMISPIFKLLYQLGSYFADPKLISQWLPFPILLATIFCLYKLAEAHAGPRFAFWLCFVFNLYLWAMKFIVGGLPRSCFYLLFFLFLYLLVKQNWLGLNICVALQALIYPTAFFLSWVTLLLELKASPEREKYKAALTTLAISVFILYFRYLYHRDHSFGSLYNIQEALAKPEFYYDHRHAVFSFPSSFMQLASIIEWAITTLPSLVLVIGLIAALYLLLTRIILVKAPSLNQPSYLWSSALASILLFIVAHLALFYLYLPHRFIAYVLPLVPIFFIATWLYQFEQLHSKKVYLLALLALVLMSARFNDDLIQVYPQERKLLKYLAAIPVDSMIVAPMELASHIPAFVYRSVLISSETDLFYHKLYHREVIKRLALQEKIYATSCPFELQSLVEEYGIDYVVLDLARNHNSFLEGLPRSFSSKRFAVLSSSAAPYRNP